MAVSLATGRHKAAVASLLALAALVLLPRRPAFSPGGMVFSPKDAGATSEELEAQLQSALEVVFSPETPQEKESLLSFSLQRNKNKEYRVLAHILPTNTIVKGEWRASAEAAKQSAARAALERRLGFANYGSARAALAALVHCSAGQDRNLQITEGRNTRLQVWVVTLILPAEMFAPDHGPMKFQAEQRKRLDAVAAVTEEALSWVSRRAASMPSFVNAGRQQIGKGPPSLLIRGLNPDSALEGLQEELEQYGDLLDLELLSNDSQIYVTFDNSISAWVAQQMLHLSLVDGNIVFCKLAWSRF